MRLFRVDFEKKFPPWVAPLFLGSCSFFVYLATLPKTISFEDSAEFVTASASLGIAHPSGYPLFVLLGHLLTLLPFGTIPWRVALLSAVSAALALTVLFAIARRAVAATGEGVNGGTEMVMTAFFGTLAFSPLWWSQAVYAKVYALHVLLLGAVVLCLLRWAESKKDRDLFLVAFFFGLACANHLFLTVIVGPWLCAALLFGFWGGWRWRYALLVAVGGMLGLLPYLYIVLRMPSAPYATVTFGHASQLLKFMARSNYGDIGVGGGDKFSLFASLCQTALEDLGVITLLLAGVGAFALARRAVRSATRASALVGVGILTVPVLVVSLRAFGFSEESTYLYRVYGLPGEAFAATLAAVGLGYLWSRSFARRILMLRAAMVLLVVVLPVFSLMKAAPDVRVTTDPFVETWLRDTLNSMPPNAVLIVSEGGQTSDTELFGLAYLQVAEGLRRDVTVVTDTTIRPFYRPALPEEESAFSLIMQRRLMLEAVLRDASLDARPLFTSFAPETVSAKYLSRATGYAYALDRKAPLPSAPHFRLPADATISFAAAAIVAHLGYLEASRYNETDGPEAAEPMLQRAMRFDPYPESSDYTGFVRHRSATESVER